MSDLSRIIEDYFMNIDKFQNETLLDILESTVQELIKRKKIENTKIILITDGKKEKQRSDSYEAQSWGV